MQHLTDRRFTTGLVIAVLLALFATWGAGLPTLAAQVFPQKQVSPDALGSISGRALDEDGAPLAGLTVNVWGEQENFDPFGWYYYTYAIRYTGTTGDDGAYSIGALPTGIYRIEISAPQTLYVDTFWTKVIDGETDDSLAIPVSGNDVGNIDVILPIGGKVSGHVSVSDDPTIDEYNITLYQLGESGYWQAAHKETITTGEGRYELNAVAPGDYRVCASSTTISQTNDSNYVPSECFDDHIAGVASAPDVTVVAGQITSGIDFVLGSSADYGSISGTLTGLDGRPAANIVIEAYPAPNPYTLERKTRTDSLGRYILDHLRPESYRLDILTYNTSFVTDDFGNSANAGLQNVAVEAGEARVNVDAELIVGGRITGTVKVQGDRPPLNGKVAVRSSSYWFYREASIDPLTGGYSIDGLPTGSYELDARAYLPGDNGYNAVPIYTGTPSDDLLPISVTVGTTVGNVDITLAEGLFDGEIQGKVHSADEPLAGIRVELFDADDNTTNRILFYIATDEEGAYSIGGLGTGNFYLRFVDPTDTYLPQYNGGHQYKSDALPIAVSDGTTVTDMDANMSQPGIVSGRILLADGSPATDHSVLIRTVPSVNDNDSSTVVTQRLIEASGVYKIENLVPGDYQLVVVEPEIKDGTYQPIEERTVYVSAVVVSAGVASAVGQNNVITLGSPTNLPTVQEPHQEPVLYLPITSQ